MVAFHIIKDKRIGKHKKIFSGSPKTGDVNMDYKLPPCEISLSAK
jgi:hypothetical protein